MPVLRVEERRSLRAWRCVECRARVIGRCEGRSVYECVLRRQEDLDEKGVLAGVIVYGGYCFSRLALAMASGALLPLGLV